MQYDFRAGCLDARDAIWKFDARDAIWKFDARKSGSKRRQLWGGLISHVWVKAATKACNTDVLPTPLTPASSVNDSSSVRSSSAMPLKLRSFRAVGRRMLAIGTGPPYAGTHSSNDQDTQNITSGLRACVNAKAFRFGGNSTFPAVGVRFGKHVKCMQGTARESKHDPDVRLRTVDSGSGHTESGPIGRATNRSPRRSTARLRPSRWYPTRIVGRARPRDGAGGEAACSGVEGCHPPRTFHELTLRVWQIEPDEDAVADDPTPRDEKVPHMARGRTSQQDVDLVLLRGQESSVIAA